VQITKRGFATAADAARARRKELDDSEGHATAPSLPASFSVNDLLDLYLDGLDADERLSAKTRFDYRVNAKSYVRPWLGKKRVRDLTPETLVAWQRKLMAEGGVKDRKALSANTVRLARSPLAGALKLAVAQGVIRSNPLTLVAKPSTGRSVPRHWTPEQARQFLANQEGDRLYPLWAFLLGSGVRIGELVWLRWDNVDLKKRRARIVEFASTLGWDLVESRGKSATAIRTVDLDAGLVAVLKRQRDMQRFESRRDSYEATDYVFTKLTGDHYHPQVISKMLARASEEAGLPRLTAHGLRHTSATEVLGSS
jgi:integrase